MSAVKSNGVSDIRVARRLSGMLVLALVGCSETRFEPESPSPSDVQFANLSEAFRERHCVSSRRLVASDGAAVAGTLAENDCRGAGERAIQESHFHSFHTKTRTPTNIRFAATSAETDIAIAVFRISGFDGGALGAVGSAAPHEAPESLAFVTANDDRAPDGPDAELVVALTPDEDYLVVVHGSGPADLGEYSLATAEAETPPGPSSGSLSVAASASGDSDLPDQYRVILNDRKERSIVDGGAVLFDDLAAGVYSVRVLDIPAECNVTGEHPRELTVAQAVLTETVFEVECVAPNQAPTATITAPVDGSSHAGGQLVNFSGSATDPQDGALTGGSLVWTSNAGGQIGIGGSVARNDLGIGTHTITLTATDSQGATGTDQITVTVNGTLQITTTSLPAGVTGIAYGANLAATGGGGSYAWSITVGTLPTGLSLNAATGEISGTPTAVETRNFTVQVASGGQTATRGLSIAIRAPSSSPYTFPAATWDTRTPAEVGLDSAKLNQFAANVGGSGMVVKDGYVVKTWGSVSSPIEWASGAKPVISTLLFFAIEEGLVGGVDDLIHNWGWALRPVDQTMTFAQVANMTGGYGRPEPPGTRWAYNDYGIRLYGLTMQRVFGTGLNPAIQIRLAPLQFEDGNVFGSRSGLGIRTTIRDFARIGWFWLNRGNWDGAQLLPQSYFNSYMKPIVPGSMPRTVRGPVDDYLGIGTFGGSSDQAAFGPGIYGYNWFFNAPVGGTTNLTWPDGPADAFQANGHWTMEIMTIIPSQNMVVAAKGDWGSFIPGNPGAGMNQNLKLLKEAAGN